MAFVTGFEFDIFISYSHRDNDARAGAWIEKFHDQLEAELIMRLGKSDCVLWRDRELQGNQKFDQTLREKLAKSAILLCFNSPSYLNSDWCRQEREWFRATHRDRLLVDDRSRIFNVLLFDIPHKDWPDAFESTSGFPFFSDHGLESSFPAETGSLSFNSAMHGLVGSVLRTLNSMRQVKLPPPGDPAPSRTDVQKPVKLFFAKVPDSLATRAKRAIEDLKRGGYQVLESVPPPYDNPAHDKAVEQRMQQADRTIHLLDAYPGPEIEGESTGYIQRHVEIAARLQTRQLIWVPKTLKLEEPSDDDLPEEGAYRSFLKDLETGSRVRGCEFVRGMESSIAHDIQNWLGQGGVVAATPPAKTTVLLDFHSKDLGYFWDLYQYLKDNNIETELNQNFDDPRRNASEFEKKLEASNALVVFYGQADPQWVYNRVNEAAKTTLAKRYPVKTFGVYLAPPFKDEDVLPDWRPLTVYPFDNTSGFDPTSIAPLLKGLNKAVAGVK